MPDGTKIPNLDAVRGDTAASLGRPAPALGINYQDVTPSHIALQQHIDNQFADRRKKSGGAYEDNYDKEFVPIITLPSGIIKLGGGITLPRKARLIAPTTTLHFTANVDGVNMGLGARLDIGSIEYDAGLRNTAQGATNGHAIIGNRDSYVRARIVSPPGNGFHGVNTNILNGTPYVEGAYGSTFDLTITTAGEYGAYFPLQANGIKGVIRSFSAGSWGAYFKEANAVELFMQLENNLGGGLRVVSGDAARFYLYLESNGRATGTTPDAADKNSHVWIGPDVNLAIAAINITLDGYLYSGHESNNSARHLLRTTGAQGLSTGGLKLWSIRPQTDGSLIMVDGMYGGELSASDLSKLRYVSGGAAVDLKEVDGAARIRNTTILRKDGNLYRYRGPDLLTDTNERNFAQPGAWNQGHYIIGTKHIWAGANESLRFKNTAPTSANDGYPLGLYKLNALSILGGGVETAKPHYLGTAPQRVEIRQPYVAAGGTPVRVWQSKAADATNIYLTTDSATNVTVDAWIG